MNNHDLARKLYDQAKHGLFVNYQERELIKTAARRLQECQQRIDDLRKTEEQLRERVAVLEERIAIMTEDQPGADTSFDPEHLDDGTRDAAAPGEAAEDFWDDDWPI